MRNKRTRRRKPASVRKLHKSFKLEQDFTNWLADATNMDVLSKCLGMRLSVVQKEYPAGDFRVDLLCRDENGHNVIIENQLEPSDHKHLGQLQVYASYHDAKVAIWITPKPRPEHCRAIDDLNANFGSSRAFYMVQLEDNRTDKARFTPSFTISNGPVNLSRQETATQAQTPAEIALETVSPPKSIWCIKPPNDKNVHRQIFERSLISMPFTDDTPNLSKLPPEQIQELSPVLYRFVHLPKTGDLVIYPTTWLDRQIHVGTITGPYTFLRKPIIRSGHRIGYPHARPVEWLYSLSRDDFSREALRGIDVMNNWAFSQVQNEAFLTELERLGSSKPT